MKYISLFFLFIFSAAFSGKSFKENLQELSLTAQKEKDKIKQIVINGDRNDEKRLNKVENSIKPFLLKITEINAIKAKHQQMRNLQILLKNELQKLRDKVASQKDQLKTAKSENKWDLYLEITQAYIDFCNNITDNINKTFFPKSHRNSIPTKQELDQHGTWVII